MIKWNQTVKDIVAKNVLMNDFYNTGAIQKASVEDLAEEIVTMCAQVANDAGMARIPLSELPNLIIEEFGFNQSKK